MTRSITVTKSGTVSTNGTSSLDQKRILSGITPSGSELHIGNYYGMVTPSLALQDSDEYLTYYFIADLHALTTVQNREVLENNIRNVVLDYLALGLNPQRSVFFRQSHVPEHSQLAVVLANYVGYGQMQRMHAFKDKLQKGSDIDAINMGLFNYPILMAADILAYKPYGVPVGEDQRQHVELTRDIAEHFNASHPKIVDAGGLVGGFSGVSTGVFPLPEPLISKATGRIIGTDGKRKMSKSLGNIISIFDSPAVIEKQIMSCYTDPNRKKATDPGKVEGNPVFIYHDLVNPNLEEVAQLKQRYQAGTVGDVEVKKKLFTAHQALFGPMATKRAELVAHPELVDSILAEGAAKARFVAQETLAEVYKVIGL